MKIERIGPVSAPIILLYGAPGEGKTTTAARFPSPLFLPVERGIPGGIEVDAIAGVNSFEAIMGALREIEAQGADNFRTIVIDTIDALEPLLHEFTCARHGWKNIETPPYGKGWVLADEEWRAFIRVLTAIRNKHGVIILLIAHAGIERIDDPRVPSFTMHAPRIHKRARALLSDASDIIAFMSRDLRVVTDDRDRSRGQAAPGRFLFLQGTPGFLAKSRYRAPAKIEVPENATFASINFWEQK